MTDLDRNDRLAATSFQLRSRERALLRNGQPVKIGARAMEILIALAEKPGELVSKNELLDRVWPKQQIEEAALRVHLSSLRRLLGTDEQERPLIVNENGRGYRLIADLLDQGPSQSRIKHLWQDFPRPLANIIGRDEILAEIARLSASRRLVTLCGPGGVGKTSLATAAAIEISEARCLTPIFFDLAPITDSALIAAALTERLGGDATAEAGHHHMLRLFADHDCLVIFDSCEHVIEGVAEAVETLLRAAPTLSILATSREPLRAEGEWLVRTPLLDLPDAESDTDVESLMQSPAAFLFIERARAQDCDWRLAEDEIPTLVSLCRKTDGLPLALEMAAAKLPSMSLAEIDRMMEGDCSALTSARRTALPHHRTLQATFDWSYDLLTEDEQRFYAELSRLDGEFTQDEVRSMAAGGFGSSAAVADLLGHLVAKSLLVADQSAGSTRYRMLGLVRAHAASKL